MLRSTASPRVLAPAPFGSPWAAATASHRAPPFWAPRGNATTASTRAKLQALTTPVQRDHRPHDFGHATQQALSLKTLPSPTRDLARSATSPGGSLPSMSSASTSTACTRRSLRVGRAFALLSRRAGQLLPTRNLPKHARHWRRRFERCRQRERVALSPHRWRAHRSAASWAAANRSSTTNPSISLPVPQRSRRKQCSGHLEVVMNFGKWADSQPEVMSCPRLAAIGCEAPRDRRAHV